jgi:tetratricopeptide (TPR) repeat protein
MKKLFAVLALAALVLPLGAQELANAQTARYTVVSEVGQENADTIAKTLEAYFDLYTSYFHFDDQTLASRLQVRSFAKKENFDAYLKQIIGGTKDDFVYLHYPTLEKSELLVFAKEDAEDYQLSLAHQAFVQYIKAFVPNAPLWLREGFAVYFEQCRLNPETGKAPFVENIAWLETVKGYKKDSGLIPLVDFLSINADAAKEKIDVYYPESWAFVSFLLESENKEVNRYLWDSIAKLKPEMNAEDAKNALVELAVKWPGLDSLDGAFTKYLDGKQTFPEMVASGIELYNAKKYDEAAALFNKAVAQNSTNHVPYYYLGLIAYAKKEYAMAEFNYKQSLTLGCEPGIGNYALGVNAFVAGRSDDAKTYLSLAKQSAPDVYGAKADEVLTRIK